MTVVAIILIVMTLFGGLALANEHLGKKIRPPVPVGLMHGGFGVLTFSTALYLAIQSDFQATITAGAGCLGITILGGLYLYSIKAKGTVIGRGPILIHATLASTGIVLVLSHLFSA